MSSKKTVLIIFLILFYILIQVALYFNYSYLAVGWHAKLARHIIIIFTLLSLAGVFFSFKIKSQIFDKVIFILNWLCLFSALLFSLINPYAKSLTSYDLYATQTTVILNPAISLGFIIFISTFFLLIPRLKNYNLKMLGFAFLPVLIWVIIRLIFIFIKTPI